jgi:hypothetical protein
MKSVIFTEIFLLSQNLGRVPTGCEAES